MQREGIGSGVRQPSHAGKNYRGEVTEPMHGALLRQAIAQASIGYTAVDTELILQETIKNIFDRYRAIAQYEATEEMMVDLHLAIEKYFTETTKK